MEVKYMGKTSKILIMAFLTISCILLLGCEKTKPRIVLSDFSEEQKELLQGIIDTDFKAFKIIGSLKEYDDIEISVCVYEKGKLIGEDNMVGMSLNKEETLKIEKDVEHILFAQLGRNEGIGPMSFIFDGKDEVDRAIKNYDRVVLLKCKFK